jgi:type IV pilus modification protein PilV
MKKQQHGFALIEVMVTAVILVIGISGMGLLLLKSIQSSQDNAQKSQGMWIVQDLAGRMRANPEGMRANAYETDAAIACDAIKMCSDYINNANQSAASDTCNPAEMATYDLWVTICGISDAISITVPGPIGPDGPEPDSEYFLYDSPSDFILNPVLNIDCTNTIARASTSTGLPDCVQYFIDLTWSTKLQQGAATADDRVFQSRYSMVLELN